MTPVSPNATPYSPMNSLLGPEVRATGLHVAGASRTEDPDQATRIAQPPVTSRGVGVSRWIIATFVAVATTTSPPTATASPTVAITTEDGATGEAIERALNSIRTLGGVTENEVPRLLGLKSGRHIMRRWRATKKMRPNNFRRLLAVNATLEELAGLVPDLTTFLNQPLHAGGPTPFDLIAQGRDRAALGVALRGAHRPPRQDLPPFRDVSGGPVAYMDRDGD